MVDKLSVTDKLLLLLQQPSEPVFKTRTVNGTKFYVDIPEEHIREELRPLKPEIDVNLRESSEAEVVFGEEDVQPIVVPSTFELPDISQYLTIPRGRIWSPFYDQHKEVGNALVKQMSSYSPDDLFTFCSLIRDYVNEQMYNYALTANILRRKELQDAAVRMNSVFELFPDRWLKTRSVAKAKEKVKLAEKQPEDEEVPIVLDQNFTATDKNPENRLAYFREDLGINSHHWHWHLVFPDDPNFKRDRRGEMFYYMHHQIVARYDAERLSNGLPFVKSFHRFDEPIPEPYFPKLTTDNSGRLWGSRPAGMRVTDMQLPEPAENFTILDLETWRDRIRGAISNGFVRTADGRELKLDAETGIDILGDIMEPASSFSVNPRFYGKFHNKGHLIIGHVHDPDGSNREQGGTITDSLTAMRDPAFYKWHKHIDNIFHEFKDTLNPYTKEELGFPGIVIDEVSVSHANTILTGWGEAKVNLAQGIDLSGKKSVMVKLKHLTHEPFEYRFTVVNKTKSTQNVCFRIFISPKYDEIGRTLSFREQKHLAIEMDKFAMEIPPNGRQFSRSSTESSVTIPMDRFFTVYERTTPNTETTLTQYEKFCGCGWPEHMLVPKGTTEGMKFDLFVVATDWRKDETSANLKSTKGCIIGMSEPFWGFVCFTCCDDTLLPYLLGTGNYPGKPCRKGTSYCGVLDEKYPDKRAMGYPFDRPLETSTTTYETFVKNLPNIKKQEITVKFNDYVLRRIDRSMGFPN